MKKLMCLFLFVAIGLQTVAKKSPGKDLGVYLRKYCNLPFDEHRNLKDFKKTMLSGWNSNYSLQWQAYLREINRALVLAGEKKIENTEKGVEEILEFSSLVKKDNSLDRNNYRDGLKYKNRIVCLRIPPEKNDTIFRPQRVDVGGEEKWIIFSRAKVKVVYAELNTCNPQIAIEDSFVLVREQSKFLQRRWIKAVGISARTYLPAIALSFFL